MHSGWICPEVLTLPKLKDLVFSNVAITDLQDLKDFPQPRSLHLFDFGSLTRLTSSAPLTAIQRSSAHCVQEFECCRISAFKTSLESQSGGSRN